MKITKDGATMQGHLPHSGQRAKQESILEAPLGVFSEPRLDEAKASEFSEKVGVCNPTLDSDIGAPD
ncbi:MAG: hypothetical protein ACI84R_001366 [Candidatus Azotimanducaceae bacterium]